MLWKSTRINISIITTIERYNAILNLTIVQHNKKIQPKCISHDFEIDLKNQKVFLFICSIVCVIKIIYITARAYNLSLI